MLSPIPTVLDLRILAVHVERHILHWRFGRYSVGEIVEIEDGIGNVFANGEDDFMFVVAQNF